MSTDTSTDPVSYRKDLRKKMDIEDKNTENNDDRDKSNSDNDY